MSSSAGARSTAEGRWTSPSRSWRGIRARRTRHRRPPPSRAVKPAVVSGPGPGLPLRVNVAGYLRSELGIGEVARQLVSALDAVGVPTLPVGLTAPRTAARDISTRRQEAGQNPFSVNLICVNADGLPAFAEQAGPGFFAGKYNIGFWWWETSSFPEKDLGAFRYLDEIWVGTRFIAEALSEVSPIPVVRVPVALDFPLANPLDPGALGLPEAFTFLFSYDYNSVAARKNPLGAFEAYTRAFGPDDGTALVLKSINSQVHAAEHRRVVEAAAARPDVIVLDDYLAQPEKDRLMASCDCYLSLHRSEGFGLTLAEAMFLGKPVVATNYSGNTDFMTGENSYPVDHRLTSIGAGAKPYPPDRGVGGAGHRSRSRTAARGVRRSASGGGARGPGRRLISAPCTRPTSPARRSRRGCDASSHGCARANRPADQRRARRVGETRRRARAPPAHRHASASRARPYARSRYAP